MRDPGPHPYVGKTIAEVVHDYAIVRGDLVEPYARAQLVDLIERRIAQARRDGAADALKAAAKELPGFDGIRTHGDAARWLRDRAALRGDDA